MRTWWVTKARFGEGRRPETCSGNRVTATPGPHTADPVGPRKRVGEKSLDTLAPGAPGMEQGGVLAPSVCP